jgi:hypothetical protein
MVQVFPLKLPMEVDLKIQALSKVKASLTTRNSTTSIIHNLST